MQGHLDIRFERVEVGLSALEQRLVRTEKAYEKAQLGGTPLLS